LALIPSFLMQEAISCLFTRIVFFAKIPIALPYRLLAVG
jgi:hypothetical protein